VPATGPRWLGGHSGKRRAIWQSRLRSARSRRERPVASSNPANSHARTWKGRLLRVGVRECRHRWNLNQVEILGKCDDRAGCAENAPVSVFGHEQGPSCATAMSPNEGDPITRILIRDLFSTGWTVMPEQLRRPVAKVRFSRHSGS
jgi:hypothetical protein